MQPTAKQVRHVKQIKLLLLLRKKKELNVLSYNIALWVNREVNQKAGAGPTSAIWLAVVLRNTVHARSKLFMKLIDIS